jgi:hypothetical protein
MVAIQQKPAPLSGVPALKLVELHATSASTGKNRSAIQPGGSAVERQERSDTRTIPWAEKDMAIAQHESDTIGFSIPLKRQRGYGTPGL